VLYAPEILSDHILPLPPITIPYTIRPPTSGSTSLPPVIYDIPILTDDPLDLFTIAFNNRTSSYKMPTNSTNATYLDNLRRIGQLDDDIALAVQTMQVTKGKVNFMRQMSDEPVGFLKKWVSSQQADEEVILGEEKGKGPEWRKGGEGSVWAGRSAREGVSLMLARPKQGVPLQQQMGMSG
jgi:SWI/SNF-related matrix-associated actin-dependent regulator of chromatin subfamily D